VKSIQVDKEKPELLKLIADLYSSNAANKSFIHSRYSVCGQTLVNKKPKTFPYMKRTITKIGVEDKNREEYVITTESVPFVLQ
jgi:hypothetical protein